MRRIIVLLMVVPVVLMFAAQPAAAQGPPAPWGLDSVSTACGFPVRVVAIGQYVDNVKYDADGSWHVVETNPGTYVVFTKVGSGESITRMNNAVLRWDVAPDGSWTFSVRGPSVWDFNPLNLDEAGLWYTTGRVDLAGVDPVFDWTNTATWYGGVTGMFIDLCPVLAAL